MSFTICKYKGFQQNAQCSSNIGNASFVLSCSLPIDTPKVLSVDKSENRVHFFSTTCESSLSTKICDR